jgi:predicted dehydrogenase
MRNAKKRAEQDSVRYAVVGLGYISQIAVLSAFSHARDNSKLTALVSGDSKKLKVLSQEYCVDHTYTYDQFSDCLRSGDIDAVYIALPNHLHHAYAKAAAEAGVYVLCEKPMAFNEAECESVIGAAEEFGVKLMIAYRLHFEAGNLHAIDLIKSGRIGEPRIFKSVFSQQTRVGNSRLRKGVGGGAVYDLGVYCINAARYLFRSEPYEVFAWHSSSSDRRFKEVPEMTSALLRFPGERLASFTCSFGASDRSVYEVVGTKGALRMDPAYDMKGDLEMQMMVGGRIVSKMFPRRDQFAPELIYFSDCILKGKDPEPSGLEGLADVRIIQAVLESAEIRRPVATSPVQAKRRPDSSQEISREPVTPPELVRAESPAGG